MEQSPERPAIAYYESSYGNFQTDIFSQIRREAFGEDIGQNSWLTSEEQDMWLEWLELSPGKIMLDVACGSGGPALRIAAATGCIVKGVDVNEKAISTATTLATQRSLDKLAEFRVADATSRLPFPEATFDAITCIDAINHFPDRQSILAEWIRLLKPGGRLLFTNPITVTGPLTNSEIAVRSAVGFFLFVPPDYDERVVAQSGLRLRLRRDLTANMGDVAERWRAARELRSPALREAEGDQAYEGLQEFLAVAGRVAREGRLSRFVYVSEKPTNR